MSLLKKIGKVVKKVATGDLLGAATTVAGAVIGGKKAKSAGNVAAGGYDAAAGEYRNALAASQGYMQPYQQAGTDALGNLNKLNSGDYSGFQNSPDYLYARSEALNGVQNSAAARGGLFSGNAGRRLAEVSSGLASQNLGNYRNALMGQIGIGQNAAGTLTNAGFNAAGGIGAGLAGSGDARASGIVGQSNAYQTGLSELGTLAGNAFGNVLTKKKKVAPKVIGPL